MHNVQLLTAADSLNIPISIQLNPCVEMTDTYRPAIASEVPMLFLHLHGPMILSLHMHAARLTNLTATYCNTAGGLRSIRIRLRVVGRTRRTFLKMHATAAGSRFKLEGPALKIHMIAIVLKCYGQGRVCAAADS